MPPWKGDSVTSPPARPDAQQASGHGAKTCEGPSTAAHARIASMPTIASQVELADASGHPHGARRLFAPRPDPLHKDGSHAPGSSSASIESHGRMLHHGTLFRDRIFDDDDWSAYASYKRYLLEPGKLCASASVLNALEWMHVICGMCTHFASAPLSSRSRCAVRSDS